MDPKDRDVFRFLWCPNGDIEAKAQDFQLHIRLFWASSCANFSLLRTAGNNQKDFNLKVIETANRNFYVVDCLKSTAMTEKAFLLVRELPQLFE